MVAQQAVNGVIFCNEERCAGICGGDSDLCAEGILVCDAVTEDVADVVYTTNNGGTWTNTAAQPFANDENIISATCFRKDKDTTRWIVVRDGQTDENAEIGYSDDDGATWTNVDIESNADGAGATQSGALFSLDYRHIWCVLDVGGIPTDAQVVFSDDGGVTWTTQYENSNGLNAVHFANYDIGYVVGDSGVVAKTDDGGETWEAVTTITDTPDLYAVFVFDENNVIVGDNAGVLWLTTDAGTSWTSLFTASAGSGISSIDFANRFVGMAIDGDDVYRTRNGGADWETVTDVPAGTEYNAVYMCDSNQAFVVGENNSNEGVVYRVAGY